MAPHPVPAIDGRSLARWRWAITTAFALGGISLSAWGPRLPAIKSDLGIDTATIGLLLAGVTVGAILGLLASTPVLSRLGVDLYQTTTLLVIAYIASSLPTSSRVLMGAVSQLQPSLKDAARTHGSGELTAWARGVLPVVSRPLVMAWLLTFCGVFLELPISQLLYAPGSPPVSVAIQDNLGNYHFGVGMAQSVLAVAVAMLAVAAVLGGYRLLAPAGWRRIGGVRSG